MRITGRTRLAGIMGWPVAHSRSPALHNFWIEEHGIDGAYVPLPVRPEQLAEALRALPVLGFRGCNLTLPHKQVALSIVDRVEPLARVTQTAVAKAWVRPRNIRNCPRASSRSRGLSNHSEPATRS